MSRLDMTGRIIMQDAFSKTFNDLEKQAKGSEATLGKLGTSMLALGGTAAAVGIVSATFELTKLGAEAQTVEKIFGNLTRANQVNGQELLAGLKAASRGAVAETELMITANRALLAGGSELASSLPQLFEIARASASATGQDIGYVFETLVKGIVKAQPLLIDNADIYIKVAQATEAFAAETGRTTDQLSSQERQMAVLNAVLADGGQFIEQMGLDAQTAAEDVQSLSAAWQDVKVAIGEALVEAGAARFLGNLAGGIQDALAIRDLDIELGNLLNTYKGLEGANDDFLEALQATYDSASKNALLGGIEGKDTAVIQYEQMITAVKAAIDATGELSGQLLDTERAIADTGTASEDAAEGVEEFHRALAGLLSMSPGGLEATTKHIESAEKKLDGIFLRMAGNADPLRIQVMRNAAMAQLAKMGSEITDEADFMQRLLLEEMVGGWADIGRDVDAQQKKMVADTKSNLERMYGSASGLQSKIESALSFGLDVTAEDMALTDAGLYKDKALEAARQFDAIAKQGFSEFTAHPDWPALLKIPPEVLAGSESELKAYAANMAGQVRDLARPDLINWDAFIANFQSQADQDAAKQLTIDIAVEKLSAAGLLSGSPEQRRKEVAKALGLEAPTLTIDALFESSQGEQDVIDHWTDGKGFVALDVALGQVVTGDEFKARFMEQLLGPGGLGKLTAADTEVESGDGASIGFRPSVVHPDDWQKWMAAELGDAKPEMPFLPMIVKPSDWTAWATDQTGNVKLSVPMSPVVPDDWRPEEAFGEEPQILSFNPALIPPDDWTEWATDQTGGVMLEIPMSPVFTDTLEAPEFGFEPTLEFKEDTVESMGDAMIQAMTRSPDPFIGAGSRMGEIMMSGIDKAIDDGADAFFERFAKRLIPEILRFLPRVGGTSPVP